MKNTHSQEQQHVLLMYYLKGELQLSRKLFVYTINEDQGLSNSKTGSQKQQQPQLDQQTPALISKQRQYCELKIYNLCTQNIHEYFTNIWNRLNEHSDNEYQQIIPQLLLERCNIIYDDLLSKRIQIQHRQYQTPFDHEKNMQMNSLKKQEQYLKQKISKVNQQLANDNPSNHSSQNTTKDIYQSLYSEQKIKAAEQYTKKKWEQQKNRKKKLLEMQKHQDEIFLLKQQQAKQQDMKSAQKRKQQVIQKQNLNHQRRDQQKMLRQQRKTQYIRVKKNLLEKPPLFQQLRCNYNKRYDEVQAQKRKRIISDRKQFLDQIDPKQIQKHSKQYQDLLLKRQKQRKQRILLMSQQEKSRLKYHSSYEITPRQIDIKDIQKQKAKEKRDKVIQYRSMVRQKFKPKIDANKRKQLMNLIEQMQLSQKRVKKTRLQNGTLMIQQLRQADAKMIGMQYLEMAKQMATRARANRRDSGEKMKAEQVIVKPINYLDQIRKNRTKSEKLAFVDSKNMSYDDKVKKVLLESEKMTELAKQNQMMLKFGKFKTSEEILACKDEIDQNYIDIVNMKLRLIISQNNPPNYDHEDNS